MSSYRFARRAFIRGVGGAIGLRVMLRNLEAMAAGATSPPRFLLTHWPVGTMRQRFLPSGSGSTYTPSTIIKPFEDAGLRADMSVFYGFTDAHLKCPGGGGHEAGTPFTTTGCTAAGTRQNGGEGDDGVAGGPSFDQVFLKNVPDLQRPGQGYANAICDARVDSNETSTQCLSYSYTARSISSANPGGNISEYTPLLPRLSPVQLYADLFANFMPGGSTPANQAAAIKALKMKKSVLDFAMRELAEMKKLAPGREAPKMDLHGEAIRKIENQLAMQIEAGGMDTGTPTCTVPTKPQDTLQGKKGNSAGYGAEQTQTDDSPLHASVAKAHAGILMAAFQCDLIRVATFQFSPGTNHVSFKGLWPSDPTKTFMHHPVSHMPPFLNGAASQAPPTSGQPKDIYEFLCNVQTWYNQRMAEILSGFKAAKDGFGNSLLDYTVVPYVTEVSEANHTRGPKPAFLFRRRQAGPQARDLPELLFAAPAGGSVSHLRPGAAQDGRSEDRAEGRAVHAIQHERGPDRGPMGSDELMRNVGAVVLAALTVLAVGCSASEDADPSGTGGSSGAGAGGSVGAGGGSAGSPGLGGGAAGMATGGMATGGSSQGGAGGSVAGAPGTAGTTSSGGAAGGAGAGGMAGTAGSAGTAGKGGAAGTAGTPSGGAGGAGGQATGVADVLRGLRIDDPCSGTPDLSDGAICPHVMLTSAGGFKAAKTVTIGGNAATTYSVTLRIRGVVEPSNIEGGTRTDMGTFSYKSMDWRKVPFTVGGTVKNADYAQWHINVASPKQDYYLNDYQKIGHYIFKLDYQVTIPMAGMSKVTLDATDSNERLIVNFEKYALDGIPGSMNAGQFVQIDVVAVEVR